MTCQQRYAAHATGSAIAGGFTRSGGFWQKTKTTVCVRLMLCGIAMILGSTAMVQAQLAAEDLVILVNANSPTSVYVANLYRQYYPQITDSQVITLDGLADCSGTNATAADEIVTRDQYETQIAQPVRDYLTTHGMVNSTKAIVTTAGLPYRIEDTTQANIVSPGGSSPYGATNIAVTNAASVESELSMLFQLDPANGNAAPINNRVVNPYQGYRGTTIDQFDRDIANTTDDMNWTLPRAYYDYPPVMEGTKYGVGTVDRNFDAGDIYLTCRLDGPKDQGDSAVYAVHDMLESAARASDSSYGVHADQAVVVLDHGDMDYTYNRVYNLNMNQDYATDPTAAPDAYYPSIREDYNEAYKQMTGLDSVDNQLNSATMPGADDMTVIYDRRNATGLSHDDLGINQGVVALGSFGVNGDDGKQSDYLMGDDGNTLFDLTYGAVFASVESFNAVTMFSDVDTGCVAQGKLVDFLDMGGSGAIGHSFEPFSDAAIDTEFLFYNLLTDADGDGLADMTFLEAAFTALPFLSWSEVIIGDPLMQIAYGPGGISSDTRLEGDVNLDGVVDMADLTLAQGAVGSVLGDDIYLDTADINRDGQVSYYDLWMATQAVGNCDPEAWGYIGDFLNGTSGDGSDGDVPGGTPQPIPEPLTVVMLAMGIVAMRKRMA